MSAMPVPVPEWVEFFFRIEGGIPLSWSSMFCPLDPELAPAGVPVCAVWAWLDFFLTSYLTLILFFRLLTKVRI